MKIPTERSGRSEKQTSHISDTSEKKSSAYTIKDFVSLAPGNKFTATVVDIKPNSVLLRLQDGSEINAKSLVLPNAHIGDNAEFVVTENFKGQILLELVKSDQNNQESSIIREALNVAGLPITEGNKQLVAEMMKNGLPLDGETLHKATFFRYSSLDFDFDKILFLLEENFPATEKTISTLNSFLEIDAKSSKNQNLKIGEQINTIISDIISEITNPSFFNDINFSNQEQKQQFIKDILGILLLGREDGETKNNLGEHLVENENKLNGSNSTYSFSEKLFTENTSENSTEAIDKLILQLLSSDKDTYSQKETKDLERAIKELASKRLSIDFDNTENDNLKINELYENLAKTIDELTELYTRYEIKGSKTTDGLQNLKDNILFMNQISNSKEYFQIPFTINGRENTGQIHIFKDSKKSKSSHNANVLISLDYVALGHIEVFVNKSFKHLSFQFRADTEKALKTINQNSYKLAEVLTNKGFIISNWSYKPLREKFNVTMTPEEIKPQRQQIKRYSFDMRV